MAGQDLLDRRDGRNSPHPGPGPGPGVGPGVGPGIGGEFERERITDLSRSPAVFFPQPQDPQGQQRLERPLRVLAVRRVVDVARGQQHLTRGDARDVEVLLVALDQQALADGGGGLLHGKIRRALVQPQVGHARRDRTGGDQHDLDVAAVRLGERVDERTELLRAVAADRRGPHLDDDAPGRPDRAGQLRCALRGGHESSSRIAFSARRSSSLSRRAAAFASMRSL